jgi:hypothetical protein
VSLIFVIFGLSWHCKNLTCVTLRITCGSLYSDVALRKMEMWSIDDSWEGEWAYGITCGRVIGCIDC